jgi:hypothetical protein
MSVTYNRTVNLGSAAVRRVVIEKLSLLFLHLEALNIRLESIVITWATGAIAVTTNVAIPAAQREHLGVE